MTQHAAALEAVLPQHAQLLRFDADSPRCSAYPSSTRFVEAISAEDVARALDLKGRGRTVGGRAPSTIRINVPFSDRPRMACAQSQVVTRRRDCAARYQQALMDELRLAAGALGSGQPIAAIHLGGPDPLVLHDEQLEQLLARLHELFRINHDADLSVEASPDRCTPARLRHLRSAGFNRLTLVLGDDPCNGSNDSDIESLVDAARDAGYLRIAVDIACELPGQALRDAAALASRVIAARPEGIRLRCCRGLAGRCRVPLAMSCERPQPMLLSTGQRLDAYRRLVAAGYVHVGLDEFALPGDAIATAYRQGRLQHGIDGFSARPESDILALGTSTVGRFGNVWYRNVDGLGLYYATLLRGSLPVARGLALDRDDLARRAVISALICQGRVDFESINLSHLIDMRAYFAREFTLMQPLVQAGLVDLDHECLELTALGRWFAPMVAGLFDRELQRDARRRQLPAVE